jgi:hypothetical protein
MRREAAIALIRPPHQDRSYRHELRDDLARACYNLALGAAGQRRTIPAALEAAREAHQLWEDLVNEGMNHLERDLDSAKKLEARLTKHPQRSKLRTLFGREAA